MTNATDYIQQKTI